MAGEPFLIPPHPTGPFRPVAPLADPRGYRTWSTRMWWRQATCPEVDCEHWNQGWVTVIDESTPIGRERADYIRYHAGRRWRARRTPEGWTAFEFPPGQTCFHAALHRVQADRAALFVAQPGDWRATTDPAHVYDRGDQFADDLHTHTDTINTARSRAGTGG